MSAAVIQLTDANKYAIIEMDLMPVAVIKDFDWMLITLHAKV